MDGLLLNLVLNIMQSSASPQFEAITKRHTTDEKCRMKPHHLYAPTVHFRFSDTPLFYATEEEQLRITYLNVFCYKISKRQCHNDISM